MPTSPLTPVTVLTGFLGSGKTTLLNRLLKQPAAANSAVLINEFGAVPIDHLLVREASENVVVIDNGCICCSVQGDLVRALRELYFGRADGSVPPFDRVIIETTGLADPAPVLRSLIELPVVAARYSLAGVVTTVDAVHGAGQLDAHFEAVKQAAMADRIVITKADLAEPAALEALRERLARLNPRARILAAVHGDVDATAVLDTALYRSGGTADVAGWLGDTAATPPARRYLPAAAPHDARIASFVVDYTEPVIWDALRDGVETLLDLHGERILRMKAIVNTGDARPRVLHAVQHTLYPYATLPAWPDHDPDRRTRLVFITRDLERGAAAAILDKFLRVAPMPAPSSAPVPAQPAFATSPTSPTAVGDPQ